MYTVIIILIILLILSNINYNVQFITKKTLRDFILNDVDNYISNMNKKDLDYRECRTREEYMKKYYDNIMEISVYEKLILSICAKKADDFLKNASYKIFDKKICDIPWKFVKLNKNIEHGYPHTRADMIFIPHNRINLSFVSLTGTLIHEKIHLYQRLHKIEFKNNLNLLGFKKIGTVKERSSNPDIDSDVYVHPDGSMMLPLNDRFIGDVIKEHPNEYVAYVAEKDYLS